MKNILKKQNLMPVLVLGVICLVVAIIMGAINLVTAPKIEEQVIAAANAAKLAVLPTADPLSFTEVDVTDDYPDEVTKIYKADTGYVFELKVKGNDVMTVMCGVDNDGNITGVKEVEQKETKSFWAKVTHLVAGSDSPYAGKNSSTLTPDLVGGATKSSTAIYNAVKTSISAFAVTGGGEVEDDEEEEEIIPVDTTTPKVERTDEEKLSLAMDMYDGDVSLESVFVYNPDVTTIGVYKNPADNTYVLHLATRTQYVALETEAMILVDNSGKVLKVNLLTWTVGHGVEYTPEYLNSFIGKTKYFTDEIELVADATTTSNNLVVALHNALFDVFGSVCATDAEIDALAYKVIPHGEKLTKVELPSNAPETVKKMYKIESGRGYVFFVSSSTERAPYETEAFIFTDINGKLMNVYIAGWVVGHNVYPDDAYVEGLKGKTIDQLRGEGEVDHVSGATGTSIHLEHAIADAMSIVPEHTNYSVIALVIILAAVLSSVGIKVYSTVRRRKRG